LSGAAVLALALMIDVCLGWAGWIYRRIGHPVTWLGRLVDSLDRQLNARSLAFANRLSGALTVVLVIALSAGLAQLVVGLLPDGVVGIVAAAILPQTDVDDTGYTKFICLSEDIGQPFRNTD